MTLRIATILGRVRRKLITYTQSKIEDEDILDAGNEVQDDIFLEADIERKFDIALAGNQETYDLADEETFEILNTILSWADSFTSDDEISYTSGFKFVPNSEWNAYRNASSTYPYFLTIFGRQLHVAPLPEASWVSSDNPIIQFWGRQKKTIVPMDENTDPELPSIFDNALVLGICKEFNKELYPEYLDAREKAITAYNNKKLGIDPPDCEW